MRVLVLLVALFGFINSSSAISAESLRVDLEFRSQMFELEIAIITQSVNISSNIRSRTDLYQTTYARLRDEIGTSLLILPGGINAALKVNAEANKIISSLLTEFSDYKILTTILNRVDTIRKAFVAVLENEIKLLEDEIDKKPKAVKCWDENKGTMRTLVGKALKEGITAVNTNLGQLDVKIKGVVNSVNGTIENIRKEVGTCGYNADCINKYIDSNFDGLAKKFEGYRDNAISSGQDSLLQVFKDIDGVFKKAATDYQTTRAAIAICVATA